MSGNASTMCLNWLRSMRGAVMIQQQTQRAAQQIGVSQQFIGLRVARIAQPFEHAHHAAGHPQRHAQHAVNAGAPRRRLALGGRPRRAARGPAPWLAPTTAPATRRPRSEPAAARGAATGNASAACHWTSQCQSPVAVDGCHSPPHDQPRCPPSCSSRSRAICSASFGWASAASTTAAMGRLVGLRRGQRRRRECADACSAERRGAGRIGRGIRRLVETNHRR